MRKWNNDDFNVFSCIFKYINQKSLIFQRFPQFDSLQLFFILFTKVLDWNWKAKMRPFEEFLSTVNNMSHFIGAEIVISNILHCIIYKYMPTIFVAL